MVYISKSHQVLHPTQWVVLITWVPSSSFNLWFATFMSDLCHCSLWHNPKQIENLFPCHVSIHEVTPIQVPMCTVHLKIFIRYPNSFYWWSRFKDELQVHSNKE
jgi:hypothetical protein